ncbi:putative serine/threonine-protein kinase [Tupanvirus soda lake]|uniref:Serine/threonine-protein kinase n=2 Tax=Tupanvirus TaxID=2094720 RepID=A0AC62AC56_9VIRU|nr:putative serine/threonine-protein kinase [Tupanvirus soda lake]QKU35253.1 putative serine/threonine-protein kinase [Tupanvirus soda lake]
MSKTLSHRRNMNSLRPKFEYDSSDDEEVSDSYQNALMSSLVALSNKSKESVEEEDEDKKPTKSRIEFIQNILDGNKLRPMIDFDNCDTETATSTRLNKKIMDVKELFMSMNVKLRYLKSGTTGHTFKAISKVDRNVAFAVKVCAYPKDDYGGMNNLSRPENAELRMLKLLSYFVIKKCTPHFVLPIGTFNTSITNFIKVPKNIINLSDEKNEMYKRFIEKYHEGEFEDFVSVLISEWCNGGDLLDYIRKKHASMTLKHWVVIIFQILFTLALVHQKYPAFRHNDMKANNILVQETDIKRNRPECRYRYNIDDVKFIIPNINLQIKIWDFDFACIDGIIENNKVNADWTKKINITKKQNRYYDMHYFFNTLISKRFFPQFYEGGAPPEIVDFVHRIIPEKYRNGSKYVNKKGRIQVDHEYTTPYKVIMEDPLFHKYRFSGDL